QRRDGDPELGGGEVGVEIVERLRQCLRVYPFGGNQLRHPAAPHGDERELGGDEEAVGNDEDENGQQAAEVGHDLFLRGTDATRVIPPPSYGGGQEGASPNRVMSKFQIKDFINPLCCFPRPYPPP